MKDTLLHKKQQQKKQAVKPHRAVHNSFTLALKQHLKKQQPANKYILLGFIFLMWGCCLLPLHQLPEHAAL